jgi:hypothetical protein
MAAWSGVAEHAALGKPLATIFSADSSSEIEAASAALHEAEAQTGGVDADPVFVLDGTFTLQSGASASRVALLPLCRIPRIVETIVVLITPGS